MKKIIMLSSNSKLPFEKCDLMHIMTSSFVAKRPKDHNLSVEAAFKLAFYASIPSSKFKFRFEIKCNRRFTFFWTYDYEEFVLQ